MLTVDRVRKINERTFRFMIDKKTYSLPFRVKDVFDNLGVEMSRLSVAMSETGLTADEIFGIWKNRRGALFKYKNRYVVAYNDFLPRTELRFMFCMKLAHIALGNMNNIRFNMFEPLYDNKLFERYEEQAFLSAILLSCQPQYFFSHPDLFNPETMAYLCDIPPRIAEKNYDFLVYAQKYIVQSGLYPNLSQPKLYRKPSFLDQANRMG